MSVVDVPAIPRVLIAEADPSIRETLSELVLSVCAEAELEICIDGREAVEWLKKQLPDLIIAARELPIIDGLSLLRGVRQLRRTPPLAFVLLSSRNDSASVREVLPLAPTAYLTKPLNIEGLRQRLEVLLLGRPEHTPGDIAPLTPGLTLNKFLEKRRETADNAPLFVDVPLALKRSQGLTGIDIHLLEQELRSDPHITAVLIAAANTAAQHIGKPIQTLSHALTMLGGVQSAQIVSGLANKRVAVLSDDALLFHANQLWGLSQRTADYARALARMLELDQERCYCAGLLQSLGDLAVVGCLQEWLLVGGVLTEELIVQALQQYSASFGSALRTRWRLPLELRELVAAVYQYNPGIFTREVLAMNLAGQMACLGENETVAGLLKSKSTKLLKLDVADLERLRKKLTGSTGPSLIEAPAPSLPIEVAESAQGAEQAAGPDMSDAVEEGMAPTEDTLPVDKPSSAAES